MRVLRVGTCLIVLMSLGRPAAAGLDDRRVADAAKSRDDAAVRKLLSQRADVNGRQPDGATALHWAVHWDDADTVNLLLRAGAGVNSRNELGVTPLSLACANGNAAITQALLSAGAGANDLLPTGESPLMTAARTGNAAVIRILLSHGAAVNAKENLQGQTALMWAAAEQHGDAVSTLLEHGADVRARSKSGFTPLLFAARAGDVGTARLLLAAGANVNDTATDGSSPLVVATLRGHVALGAFLLDHGADPNAAGLGYTALHWAAGSWETEFSGPRGVRIERNEEWDGVRGLERGRLEFVRALLAHGANPNATIDKAPPRVGFSVFRPTLLAGATPFFVAAMSGHADVMRALVQAGADPLKTTKEGMTPLMAAAGVGRVLAETRLAADATLEAAKLAWELGNDVNAANAAGETALHGAAHTRSDALVQFLVDHGAALNATNRRGETPLMIAERTVSAGSAPVFVRTSTGDLLRRLGAIVTAPPEARP